jgi:16S rRNA G966 N2-methylase RsmD
LSEDGVLIVEHHAKKQVPETVGNLRRWRTLKQGDTILSFYEPK